MQYRVAGPRSPSISQRTRLLPAARRAHRRGNWMLLRSATARFSGVTASPWRFAISAGASADAASFKPARQLARANRRWQRLFSCAPFKRNEKSRMGAIPIVARGFLQVLGSGQLRCRDRSSRPPTRRGGLQTGVGAGHAPQPRTATLGGLPFFAASGEPGHRRVLQATTKESKR